MITDYMTPKQRTSFLYKDKKHNVLLPSVVILLCELIFLGELLWR